MLRNPSKRRKKLASNSAQKVLQFQAIKKAANPQNYPVSINIYGLVEKAGRANEALLGAQQRNQSAQELNYQSTGMQRGLPSLNNRRASDDDGDANEYQIKDVGPNTSTTKMMLMMKSNKRKKFI